MLLLIEDVKNVLFFPFKFDTRAILTLSLLCAPTVLSCLLSAGVMLTGKDVLCDPCHQQKTSSRFGSMSGICRETKETRQFDCQLGSKGHLCNCF